MHRLAKLLGVDRREGAVRVAVLVGLVSALGLAASFAIWWRVRTLETERYEDRLARLADARIRSTVADLDCGPLLRQIALFFANSDEVTPWEFTNFVSAYMDRPHLLELSWRDGDLRPLLRRSSPRTQGVPVRLERGDAAIPPDGRPIALRAQAPGNGRLVAICRAARTGGGRQGVLAAVLDVGGWILANGPGHGTDFDLALSLDVPGGSLRFGSSGGERYLAVPLRLSGLEGKLELWASEEFLRSQSGGGATATLIGGLALTALFAGLMYFGLTEGRRLEALVRQRTEELSSQARKLSRIMDASPDGIAVLDGQRRVLQANRRMGELLGRAPASLVGEDAVCWLHDPGEADRFLECCRSGAGSVVVRLTDGQRAFDAEITAAPVDDAREGGLSVWVVRDVSERLATLRALEASERRFADVAEAAAEYITEFDAEGRVTYVSDRIREILGYEPEEVVGRKLDAFMTKGLFQEWEPIFDRILERPTPYRNLETPFLSKDGRIVWLSSSGKAIFDEQGRFAGYRTVSTDVTESRLHRDEVERLNAELEERVRQRTEQLQAAIQELEAFSYSVAHDLRAPLRSVEGFGAILEQDYGPQLDDEARRMIARMRAASRRMAELIDDLLALSRVARQPIQPQRVDLSEMVRRIGNELSSPRSADQGESLEEMVERMRKSPDPDHRVEIVVEEGVSVRGDPGLLQVLVGNLLSNAIKYSSKNPSPKVEFFTVRRNGKRWLAFRDNGVGFDPQFAGSLFKPFHRLHSNDEFEGTGIGLALVQRVVQRHAGQVEVESAPGQGATFYVWLPD